MRVPIQVTCIDERVAGLIAGAAGIAWGLVWKAGSVAQLVRAHP